MESIVITEFMDTDAVNALSEHFNVIYDKTLVNHQDKLLELVADCGAIIVRNKTQVRGSLLEAAGNLRVVGRLGVGLDNIDMEETFPLFQRQERTIFPWRNTSWPVCSCLRAAVI